MEQTERLTCREAGNKCEFNVAHDMVYDSQHAVHTD